MEPGAMPRIQMNNQYSRERSGCLGLAADWSSEMNAKTDHCVHQSQANTKTVIGWSFEFKGMNIRSLPENGNKQ
jgi:hypothetical protein